MTGTQGPQGPAGRDAPEPRRYFGFTAETWRFVTSFVAIGISLFFASTGTQHASQQDREIGEARVAASKANCQRINHTNEGLAAVLRLSVAKPDKPIPEKSRQVLVSFYRELSPADCDEVAKLLDDQLDKGRYDVTVPQVPDPAGDGIPDKLTLPPLFPPPKE